MGNAVLAGPSDEDRIREQLSSLASAVSSSEPVTNAVFRASYLRERFEDLLAPGVLIDVPEVGRLPSDPKSLALATARVQTGFGSFEVELGDMDIEIGTPDDTAIAQGQVELTATGSWGRREERHVVFHLTNRSGTWLVSAIHVEAPGKPATR